MKTYRTKTFSLRKEDSKRTWRLLDAHGQILGNFASQVSQILVGKDKATYTPHIDGGDYLVIINASEIVVTGNKSQNKVYTRHSNYPGGFSKESYSDLIQRKPEAILRAAVKGMLPKNRLRDPRLDRLKIFAGSDHTYSNYIK